MKLCSLIAPVALIVCLSVTARSALAEEVRKDVPVALVQYFFGGSVTLDGTARADQLELESRVVSLRAMYGHRFDATSTTLMTVGRYNLALSRSRLNSDASSSDSYHFPSLKVVLLQGLRGPWGLMAYAVGGSASDMKGFSADDLRYAVGAGATYSVSPDLRLSAGAMVTNMFDHFVVLPILDISYRAGKAMFRLGIPDGLSAWLSLTPSVDLGIVLGKVNFRYTLHARDRVADQYSTLDVTLGPAARVFLWGGVYLQGEGGYNARRFKLLRDDRVAFERFTFKGWFVSTSLGYML